MAQALSERAAAQSLPHGAADGTASAGADRRRHITLVVEGMHCGNCIRTVEQALAGVEGVTSARVNLSTGRAHVTASPGGVALEPLVDALERVGFKGYELVAGEDSAADHENADYLRRLGVAGFAAANIMLMSVAVWAGIASDMESSLKSAFHWLSAIIAFPAVAYAGQPFFKSARAALAAGRLNMDVPISLGVLLATAMSLYQTIRGSDQVYFDAAVTLLFFLLIGRTLDRSVRARAAGAAQNLLGLRATSATVIHPDSTTQRLPTRYVVPGMRLLIAAGERVPVDARISKGRAEIDESLITGESRPRTVEPGEVVYAGTINLNGAIEAEALKSEDNTLLADIARLMSAAEQARGKYVRLADRAARLYAPAVHVLGLATLAGWVLLGLGWEPGLTAAVAVLIITCPCALALAVPAVQVVAASRLFSAGIVLKAPDGLERLAEVDTVVLDKTGTLTLGEPALLPDQGLSNERLALAASLAVASRHPYSRAIVKAAKARGLIVAAADAVEEVAGGGLRMATGCGEVRLGSARFCGIGSGEIPHAGLEADNKRTAASASTLWLVQPGGVVTALHFDDPLRPDAAQAVRRLRALGLEVEILSGDGEAAVEAAAAATGISTWRAAQSPAQKIARLEELAAAGRKVLMVGDGLNDAPALAAGHASLSPSSAADVSQTAADAVFQGERLGPVVAAVETARTAHRRALENFAIAIGYNLVFVPMAVVGWATPLIAAIAMSASSIAVTANSLRIKQPLTRNSP